MISTNPKLEQLVDEFWIPFCEEYGRLRQQRLNAFTGYLVEFLNDLLNYPLVRPWRESLNLFQEHYWQQIGLQLTSESYEEVAALIEREVNDPTCFAHGPIQPDIPGRPPRRPPGGLVGNPKSKHPLDIPEGDQENMRRGAHRIADVEQQRIALSDEEAARFAAYIYENIRRQYTGERAIEYPDYWHAKNDALNKKNGWDRTRASVAARKIEPAKAAAELHQEERPAAPLKPADQRTKPVQTNAREQFYNEKLAAAQGHFDEMRRLLDAIGQRLDAAKIDEEVDVDADVDEIEGLIWRYNDALESARDAWLRDNLSGDANTRLLQMQTPASLGLPLYTDDQQAQRAMHQGLQISERLGSRNRSMDRVIAGMRTIETAGTVAGLAVGGGILVKAAMTGGKWAVVKTIAVAAAGIAVDQGVEKGLRAAGASEQTITGARLAAAVVTLILLRRRSGSGSIAVAAETPKPPGRGIWDLTPEARWTSVEERLGKNLPGNFKTIDKFEGGVATSIKSLDLGAKSYANPSSLTRVVQGYIDKVAAFKGIKWNKTGIESVEVKGRSLELAIPPDGTDAQLTALQALIEYGKEHGVIVKIVEMW